jgi:hypothetical protein
MSSVLVCLFSIICGSNDPFLPLLPSMLVLAMTNFLRSQEYKNWEWYFTTGHVIDNGLCLMFEKSSQMYGQIFMII